MKYLGPEPLAFRAATGDDVASIVALVQSAYRGESSRAGWTTEADLLDGQRTDAEAVSIMIATASSRLLLCEQAGVLVATAHLEKQGPRCRFGLFAVQPERQATGLGEATLTEAERIARHVWHCDGMQMTVISLRTELIAWYERRGYRPSGDFAGFPYGDERFGIPKRPDLRLQVLYKRLC